jgi:hypothetical protein
MQPRRKHQTVHPQEVAAGEEVGVVEAAADAVANHLMAGLMAAAATPRVAVVVAAAPLVAAVIPPAAVAVIPQAVAVGNPQVTAATIAVV